MKNIKKVSNAYLEVRQHLSHHPDSTTVHSMMAVVDEFSTDRPGAASAMYQRTRADNAGLEGELCYRTACQRPGAWQYNIGTRKYYCHACAAEIRDVDPSVDLFPEFDETLANRVAVATK